MNSMLTHRIAMVVVVAALVLASGGMALGQTLQPIQPIQPIQPLQPLATEVPDSRPGTIPTIDPDADLPTRPSVPTPTPHPARQTPVPTSDNPLGGPTAVPASTEPVEPTPTAIAPNPQPNQPTVPPINQPTPTPAPLVPGQNNRFKITLFSCPAGTDPASDEATLLAACELHVDHAPNDVAFHLRDGDQTHVRYDTMDGADDSTYTFDGITIIPGLKFFILEEFDDDFNAGYADPTVFCAENGGSSQHIAAPLRTIRPDLTTFSNVTYTCNWFKLPLEADSIHLFGRRCMVSPTASQAASFDWLWTQCVTPWEARFVLTDAQGWHGQQQASSRLWTDVDFGPSNAVEIWINEGITAPGYSEQAFCGSFNNGDPMTMADRRIKLAGDGGAAISEHVCWWFLYPSTPSFDQSIQMPNRLNVWATLCPADLPVDPDPLTYISSCSPVDTAAVGVDMTLVYPDSAFIATLPTTQWSGRGRVSFGLVGAGQATLVPSLPAGYDSYRFICSGMGLAFYPTEAYPTTINLYFGWGDTPLCRIHYIPEGALPAPATPSTSLAFPDADTLQAVPTTPGDFIPATLPPQSPGHIDSRKSRAFRSGSGRSCISTRQRTSRRRSHPPEHPGE